MKDNKTDDRSLRRLYKSKNLRAVRFHDGLLGRKNNFRDFKKDILQTKNSGLFYDISINEIESILKKQNDNITVELDKFVKNRLEKYIDTKNMRKLKIHLYVWKYDAGFSLIGSTVYLNLYQIVKDKKNIEDILIHEAYHARSVNILYYLRNKIVLNQKTRLLSKLFSSIFEEGIATLVERGSFDNISVNEENVNKLNEILLSVVGEGKGKKQNVNSFLVHELSTIYECGYYYANLIYINYGREALGSWSKYYDWDHMIDLLVELKEESMLKVRERRNK